MLFYAWIGERQAWYFPSFLTFSIILLFYACAVTMDHVGKALGRFVNKPGLRVALPGISSALLLLLFMTANNYEWNFGEYPNRGGFFTRRSSTY